MNKKIFLTSAIVFGLCCPAFAEEFPSNGLMQENTTYDNAATYGNLGAYSGTVNATANYEDLDVYVQYGYYLPAGSETQAICPANSFCPDGEDTFTYNATNNQGIHACSSVDNGNFPYSQAGIAESDFCYRNCTTSDIRHSTAVTGRYLLGGDKYCAATACENGYTLAEFDISNYSANFTEAAYITGDDDFDSTDDETADVWGLYTSMDWAATDAHVMPKGTSACSPRNGTAGETVVDGGLVTGEGTNCYCKMTSVLVIDKILVTNGSGMYNDEFLFDVDSPWVYLFDLGDEGDCLSECSYDCAHSFLTSASGNSLTARNTMMSTATVLAKCEANLITINWGKDSNRKPINTYCEYNGDIRTPSTAPQKTGKRFLGWTIQKGN